MIAIDTETNITDSLQERILVGISFAGDGFSYYIPVGHKETLFGDENYKGPKTDWQTLFQEYQGTVVMHNAKFDLHILMKNNVYVYTLELYDTMLMSHMIDENSRHALKELAKTRLGIEESKELQENMKRLGKHFGYEGIPAEFMGQYAAQDAEFTLLLFADLWEDFQPYLSLWDRERMFLLTLLQMERRGIPVNVETAALLANQTANRMHQIRSELGFDPAKPSVLASKLYSSPPEGLGLKPLAFGVSSRPTMNEAVLSTYGHPVTALVLEYRTCTKMLSSYYRPYQVLAGGTQRIHPTFKQHGTVTGRMSCENPNLQQVPRDSPVKKLFMPEDGCELWEFDYRNIEMRLAAVYAQEESLLEVFRNEGDIHGAVANELGIDRHAAKTMNFLILYGGGPNKLAQTLRIANSSAFKIHEAYKSRYPKLIGVMDSATAMAESQGWVKLWTGRRRHFQWPSEHRKAFNSVIQGGAFEIVKDGMIRLHHAGYTLCNQVHDAVWVQIAKSDVPNAQETIPELMSQGTEEAFGLKFTVDAKRLN